MPAGTEKRPLLLIADTAKPTVARLNQHNRHLADTNRSAVWVTEAAQATAKNPSPTQTKLRDTPSIIGLSS